MRIGIGRGQRYTLRRYRWMWVVLRVHLDRPGTCKRPVPAAVIRHVVSATQPRRLGAPKEQLSRAHLLLNRCL
jgi:hypothetical protein